MKSLYKYTFFIYFVLFVLTYCGARLLFTQQRNIEAPVNVLNHLNQKVLAFYQQPEKYIHYELQQDSITYWNNNIFDKLTIEKIIHNDKSTIWVNDIFYITEKKVTENGTLTIDALPIKNQSGQLLLYDDGSIKEDNSFRQNIEFREGDSEFEIPLHNGEKLSLNYESGQKVAFIPTVSIIVLASLALVFLISSMIVILHHCYYRFSRLYVWIAWALCTILFIKFNQTLIPIPFNLEFTLLFSPELFSSIEDITSFAMCILSISILTLMVYSYNIYIRKRELELNNYHLLIKLVSVFLHTFLFFHYFLSYILTLIRDSRLSFEFYDLNRVNLYSFLALFIISLCLLSLTICVYNIKRTLDSITLKFGFKLLILLAFLLINILLFSDSLDYNMTNIVVFGLIFFGLWGLSFFLPFPFDQGKSSIFSIFTIKGFLWYVLIGSVCSIFIFKFSRDKEQNLRMELANAFFLNDNLKNEFEFATNFNELILQQQNTDDLQKKATDLAMQSFQKFDLKSLQLLTPKDSLIQTWSQEIVANDEDYQSTLSLSERIYEICYPIVRNDSLVQVMFAVFEIPNDVTSRILNTFDKNQFAHNYSVALYYKNQLVSYSGKEYANLVWEGKMNDASFHNTFAYSLYAINGVDEQTVIVRYENNVIFSYLSILSYSLILFLINTFLLAVLNRIWSYRTRNKDQLIPFKLKLNIGVVMIVFFTFFVFATITTMFIYHNSKNESELRINRRKLETIQAIHKIIDQNNQIIHTTDALETSQLLKALLIRPRGELIQTYFYYPNGYALSLNNNFQLINPKILSTIRASHQQNAAINFLTNDKEETYFTIYNDATLLGIFSIKENKNPQIFGNYINDAISVLINLYIFLLLLSILLSIFIAQRLTASLEILTQQFRNMKLSDNKLIQYNQKDDLTLIVHEYNNMIKHVEAMAVNLANSERESAWRDAAKQVAHEINNPITPIKLNIQYMIKEAEAGKDISNLFLHISPTILEQIEQLAQIAKNFSDFAKMPEPQNEETDIVELISNVINLMKINHNTSIELHKPTVPVIAFIDPKFINIIYFNLIKNAIQAVENKENAKVIVSIEKSENQAFIKIEDNGIGIAPESLEKIFMPNFTTKSSGTGIGLSTTKSMLIALGGNIEVESVENEGTIFTTKFPILH